MKKMKTMKTKIIILIVGAVLMAGLGTRYFIFFAKDKPTKKQATKETVPTADPKITIVDPNSKSRPFAVMINNIGVARPFQSGLQDAYIIYEIIVEGGITRMMAVFKDQDTAAIGSVRSSRHYFLDYALENDAIYVHWGWSTVAQSDIPKLGINNINGLAYEGIYFYRNKEIDAPLEHTGFTNMELLNKAVTKLNYRQETNKDLLLNYTAEKVDLSKTEGAKVANNVTIDYSNSLSNKYVYDPATEVYMRYVNNKPQVDNVTKEQYHFKNIIVYQVANSDYDASGKLQVIDNIGSGTGYYITNGYAAPIKWQKDSRAAQTVYTYENGQEINVSDGNTFIQIQPTNQDLIITE